jgi:hypothetical protein
LELPPANNPAPATPAVEPPAPGLPPAEQTAPAPADTPADSKP